MDTAEIEIKADKSRIEQVFNAQRARSLVLRTENIKQRLVRLKKLQQWIEKNRDAIRTAVYNDFRKPKTEVDISEIYPVTAEIKHTITHLKRWAKPKKVDAPLTYLGSTSYVQYEPKGVCLIISPWNYPFNLAIGPLVSAIAAGNTAIIKPSEITPNTSELIDTLVGELFPEDEVAVIQGGIDTSTHLLSIPFDHIFFTGSPAVGKIVMQAASKHLTSVTLELGGKSPVVVDESASLNDAAEKIAWGKLLNNGQTCVAPDYLLISEKVTDRFLPLLKRAMEKQFDHKKKGFQSSSDYTRIVNDKHFERINDLIKDAIDKGGDLFMGGEVDAADRYIAPTIITHLPEDARLMEEEIFGPILPVVTFSNLDEALKIINAKPKALSLYYFGKSGKNRKRILLETSSGGTCINDCVLQFSHNNLPFGGVNNSGLGKSHGHYGFLAFSNEKAVLKQRVGLTSTKTIYPPYTKAVQKLVDSMIKYF